jgi:hypothetical protein
MSTVSHNLGANETRQAAQADFNFLAMLAMPDVFRFAFPAFYLTLFQIIIGETRPIARYALGFPRGFAKTTWIKLLVVWHILFSDKKFILIVCATEDLAINVIADIIAMLSHPNMVTLFGSWERDTEESQKHKKVFYFRGRTIVLQGIGAQGSVRGINRGNARPDLMVMDDIQKKEDARNPELAKALMDWMVGTLMKAKSELGCTFIFVGNMYPQNSILAKLQASKYWTSFIVGGILEDGQSLWEELKPIEQLLEEWESDKDLDCEDAFLSEVLNSTDIKLSSGIKLESITSAPSYYEDIPADGSYIIIDPSSGKKDGDDCTINFYEIKDTRSILTDIEFGTFTPIETIRKAIAIGLRTDTRLILVEDVAYQSTLLFWFNYICETEGIEGFEFHPVSPKNKAKPTRIKLGANRVIKGEILLHKNVLSLVKNQYETWNPLKTTNKDDIIDPIGYVEEVEQKYLDLAAKRIWTSQEVLEASEATDCPF